MIDRRLFTNIDWMLVGLVIVISMLGIVNIYSATTPYKIIGAPYYVKQFYWMAFGMFIALLICSIDYHILEDFSYWLYFLLVLLLVAVLLVGRRSMGATRWLHLGFFNIQPSELMKIVIIITFARFFNNFHAPGGMTVRDLMFPLGILAVPALLIMKQPDLGTATLVVLIAMSMTFYVGLRWTTIVSFILVTIPTCWLAWSHFLRPYQKNRILDFLNPERSRLGSGYHIIQSKIAVGSGGLFGKGFIKGTQSQLRFLPEQHTDFAFSVFTEEWGFIGALVLIILYLSLVLWGLNIARRCNDRFGSLLAMGVTAMLFWHIVINMGMVIGMFPVVGVPMPFFSYGGTSMITSMVGIGILQNISMRRFMF
ncbi:rod shape-determining protein RodA [Geobacter sp. SVR]|uniref:rod shape-determining protein RodA n=1 Tax=Geobacter sp. SVR TaxID=2495594 RepID=UPI00143EFB43|nr:rod shape-determining protein RodA [Geobacter sp. SVR]BCS54481.1 rod shape-determining protein RodA [Geobacter sp. SVR]GCF87080.1 rod shape-determining protein RodA [Geobacter sp. SVR]